jgi:ABC-type multidrug transport system fused ATPase/permease subunit
MDINLLSHYQQGGSITFKDVHFSYPSNPDRKILNGLSLHVPAGKKVAIVGSSGSGKSTIYRLLYRFYDADSGQVLVDQQDVRNITLHSLRSVRVTTYNKNLPYWAYFI